MFWLNKLHITTVHNNENCFFEQSLFTVLKYCTCDLTIELTNDAKGVKKNLSP